MFFSAFWCFCRWHTCPAFLHATAASVLADYQLLQCQTWHSWDWSTSLMARLACSISVPVCRTRWANSILSTKFVWACSSSLAQGPTFVSEVQSVARIEKLSFILTYLCFANHIWHSVRLDRIWCYVAWKPNKRHKNFLSISIELTAMTVVPVPGLINIKPAQFLWPHTGQALTHIQTHQINMITTTFGLHWSAFVLSSNQRALSLAWHRSLLLFIPPAKVMGW